MKDMSLMDYVSDLDVSASRGKPDPKERRAITIQVGPDAKVRYDRLQDRTDRRFGKKAREMLIALIDAAESRVKV